MLPPLPSRGFDQGVVLGAGPGGRVTLLCSLGAGTLSGNRQIFAQKQGLTLQPDSFDVCVLGPGRAGPCLGRHDSPTCAVGPQGRGVGAATARDPGRASCCLLASGSPSSSSHTSLL